jgi:ariadne-1
MQKCDADGGLFSWIAENSKAGDGQNEDGVKPCPKCAMPIEKNGACPVMRCGGHAHTTGKVAVGCGCEFCWVCEQVITGGHSCNRVAAGAGAKGGKTDKDDFQYLGHYYRRYQHHDEGKNYDVKNRATQQANVTMLEDQMIGMEGSRAWLESIDPSYLVTACELLIGARRKLKWTYAHAYFLDPSPAKTFFEFLQGNLEEDVESLADLIENKVPRFGATANDVLDASEHQRESLVQERQEHRSHVLGGIMKVCRRADEGGADIIFSTDICCRWVHP